MSGRLRTGRPAWGAGVAWLRAGALAALLVAAVACGGSDRGSPGGSGSTRASAAGASPVPASFGTSGAPSGASPSGGPSLAGSPSGAGASAAPSAGTSPVPEGDFRNPAIDDNFADPFILRDGDTWYAYATGNLTWNIQVSTSTDLVAWSASREALPRLAPWEPVSKGLSWAPEVVKTDAGYVMHYTGRDVQAGKQCLSVAVAAAPDGPFQDASDRPLECQTALGGSIDSSPFTDADGSRWLVWKNDGNCCGLRTRFFLARLDETGTKLVGKPRDLGLENDRPWERNVIEAPQLLLHDGTYYLFYSANDYASKAYAVGYATSTRLAGPYTDAPENPILASSGAAAGPGHQTVFADADGTLWIAYHAWDPARIGDNVGGRRALWIDRLSFEDGRPVVHGPDADPQPAPVP